MKSIHANKNNINKNNLKELSLNDWINYWENFMK
ncbi:hypothetical protein J2X97_000369 [Epilithonimonas hungarica]|nr:hypothetical protein [Epilithonimonas hungarica]